MSCERKVQKIKKTVLNNIIFYNVSAGYENNRERDQKKIL